MPKQKPDTSMSDAVGKVAEALSKQAAPVVNVEVKSPEVNITNKIEQDDQRADRKEFLEKMKVKNG